MGGLDAQRQAGVVDQDVDVAPAWGRASQRGVDGGLVRHIQRHRTHVRAQLDRERIQAVLAASAITTVWPLVARVRAIAAPNPAEAPVIKTIMQRLETPGAARRRSLPGPLRARRR